MTYLEAKKLIGRKIVIEFGTGAILDLVIFEENYYFYVELTEQHSLCKKDVYIWIDSPIWKLYKGDYGIE